MRKTDLASAMCHACVCVKYVCVCVRVALEESKEACVAASLEQESATHGGSAPHTERAMKMRALHAQDQVGSKRGVPIQVAPQPRCSWGFPPCPFAVAALMAQVGWHKSRSR